MWSVLHYESIRALLWRKIAGVWCSQYERYDKSLCLTMAIRLIKLCDHRRMANTIECLNIARQELDKYMARVGGVLP